LDAGVWGLELQLPFSDPTADGPVIQEACSDALAAGFRVDDGLALLAELRSRTDAPLFVMSYASIPVRRGVERFVREATEAGASGFIVPDLPPDSDEGLYEIARAYGAPAVPVLVAGMAEQRIEAALARDPEYLYVALRRGTTGSRTELGEENISFLRRLAESKARLMAGFGIRDRDQVEALDPWVHSVVVGSAFVREVAAAARTGGGSSSAGAGTGDTEIYRAVREKAEELIGHARTGAQTESRSAAGLPTGVDQARRF
jgi:tryptophan synthase alpha chain